MEQPRLAFTSWRGSASAIVPSLQSRQPPSGVRSCGKIQIEFNTEYVLSYRLIGYENRILEARDFNDDSKFKRKIIGLLNKLTDKNKYTIYDGIKEIINTNNDKNMIFDILWEYNKNNYKEINIDIFNFLSKETLCSHIDAKWNNYISNKEWNPPDFIYDNDILLIDDKYDIYCDYIKWKKNTSNLNKLWIKFKLEDIDILAEQILEFVLNIIDNSSAYKHIIDIFLEQLIQIISAKKNINIINKKLKVELRCTTVVCSL